MEGGGGLRLCIVPRAYANLNPGLIRYCKDLRGSLQFRVMTIMAA